MDIKKDELYKIAKMITNYSNGGLKYDALGAFRFDGSRMKLFLNNEKERQAIECFLPKLNLDFSLSRGRPYYEINLALKNFDILVRVTVEVMDRYKNEPSLQNMLNALLENVINVLIAVWYNMWCSCIDNYKCNKNKILLTCSKLIRQIENITSCHLHVMYPFFGSLNTAKVDWDFIASIYEFVEGNHYFRQFREYDNKPKIINEIIYNESYIIHEHSIDTILFPLYGSLTLAIYYRTFKEMMRSEYIVNKQNMLLVRVGFHDLSDIDFYSHDGNICWNKIVPQPMIRDLFSAIQDKNVLIIDDNIGYGKTLNFCKYMIKNKNGIGYSRSAETAWHLYKKCGSTHDISGIVDFPSLRSNFHHSVQEYLIKCLSNMDYINYSSTISKYENSLSQMLSNLKIASDYGNWSQQQLKRMKNELYYARQNYNDFDCYDECNCKKKVNSK
ncbi:hypothetical protein HZI73_16810 [Vallitalea pronyensis]|uniref:Uncharacterized protein n=1 Tax=Vallitalea pronyensis TaxID=1348613 RepID=A0A8J8MM66_9FIRM|nr:hypothetical protein [Vallitalea pronyensis]QUI23853.1 hypothetical protein HZI73_16810 [Vallitalea pronyensis]